MTKGIVYKFTFEDGKVYIGNTRRNPAIRIREYFDETLGPLNPAFWEAYKTYDTPRYEVLIEVKSCDTNTLIEELSNWTRHYMRIYKSRDPKYGYNRMQRFAAPYNPNTNSPFCMEIAEIFVSVYKRMYDYKYNIINHYWDKSHQCADDCDTRYYYDYILAMNGNFSDTAYWFKDGVHDGFLSEEVQRYEKLYLGLDTYLATLEYLYENYVHGKFMLPIPDLYPKQYEHPFFP